MQNISLKDTFDNVVAIYDSARPLYPKQLLKDVQEFSERSRYARALEVGAGTGQATDLFLPVIDNLDIVEVGDNQVKYLKEKYQGKNVCTHKAYFEDFNSDNSYDLIFSATAFHWVKEEIGYPKAWDMLVPGGTMAVFWHMSSVTFHDTGIFVGLNNIKKKYLQNAFEGFDKSGIEGVRQRRISQIRSGNCFGEPVIKEYRFTDIYDADRYALLLESYSSTQTLDADSRKMYLDEVRKFISENGGIVEMPQHVMLYLVKRERD